MSYALSAALQQAVYLALITDPGLSDTVGTAIYDAVPAGVLPDIYISLGPEVVRVADDKTGSGAIHRFTISVVTAVPGFRVAKEAAGTVCDVLHDADMPLDRGRLVSMRFERARAGKIDKGSGRKIDLTFRARVEDE